MRATATGLITICYEHANKTAVLISVVPVPTVNNKSKAGVQWTQHLDLYKSVKQFQIRKQSISIHSYFILCYIIVQLVM